MREPVTPNDPIKSEAAVQANDFERTHIQKAKTKKTTETHRKTYKVKKMKMKFMCVRPKTISDAQHIKQQQQQN